jgi:4-hydroxythreonine-4-phosphate dehydrogenase
MAQRPVVVTMGEPAGIGGEILLKAWLKLRAEGQTFLALDDPRRLAAISGSLGLDVPVATVASPMEASRMFAAALPVLPLTSPAGAIAGKPDVRYAAAILESIERACALVRSGEVAAIVTNPIQKSVLAASGFRHPGHTEFLGALAGVERPVMMLVGPDLRVVPLTVHVPHADVPRLLRPELIIETARVVQLSLQKRFGIVRPRLALAGLNPHAGESGTIGREEIEVMIPAAEALRREGILITDPLSADTLFHAAARRTYDAALCPTHDQALIPLKTLAFDQGVNLTIGLPFVRTSPDHGTALDIAGHGVARPDSLIAAILLAHRLGAADSPNIMRKASHVEA